MSFDYEEACRYLIPRLGGGTRWSLGPTRELLKYLGNPQETFRSIHVGGTNGKGSVVSLVAEVLEREGRRVGRYTSPHLVSVRERVAVDGVPISRDAFASWAKHLKPMIESTGASFFEAGTAIAFADFAARGVELAVVEVGLGGRLDSTNVLDPVVSAVTHVAADHAEYLGDDVRGVAVEKAHIAKEGRPFVIGVADPELARLMTRTAVDRGAIPYVVAPDARYLGELSLRGPHQRRNAAVARAVLEVLPEDLRPATDVIEAGFSRARVPGRFDVRGRWIFDVGHNEDATRALVAALAEQAPPRPVHGLVAILRDKNYPAMISLLREKLDHLYLTVAPSSPESRRWDLGSLDVEGADVTLEPDFDRALAAAQRRARTILVTGSVHTVGDALGRLPGFRPLG